MQQYGSKYFGRRHILDPVGGVKRSIHCFLKLVMLHIKLKKGAQSTMQAHILSLNTQLTLRLSKKNINIFSESSHVAYQIKSNGA